MIGSVLAGCVLIGTGVAESGGTEVEDGRGVRVGGNVGRAVVVGVGVDVAVSVRVGDGVGVPTSGPGSRERYTRYPMAATRTSTKAESRSFLIC